MQLTKLSFVLLALLGVLIVGCRAKQGYAPPAEAYYDYEMDD